MTPRHLQLIAATMLVVVLAGCAPRAAQRPTPPPPPVASQVEISFPEEAVSAVAEEEGGLRGGEPQIELGTGRFIDHQAASRPVDGAGPAGEVTFNFEGESLHAVVKAILGDFLQQNYVIAPGVQGSVTFSTAKPLRGDQALSVLEMLLRWNNATLVWEDGRYTILPVQQAIPGNLTPRLGSAASARGFEVRAVPLRYISATEMEKLLKPYARPEAVVSVDNARNMIVLAGTRSELENYLQTVAVFDVDWLEGMSVGIYPLQQADVGEVVPQLEQVFGPGADTPMAGMFRFLPLEGINAVLVITSQPAYLARAEEWLHRLDLGGGEAGVRLYVYDVKNVKAADLAATLGEVFGTGGGSQRRDADVIAPGVDSVEIRSLGRSGRPTPPDLGAEGAKSAQAGGTTSFQGSTDAPPAASGPVVDAAGGIALGVTDEVRVSAVEESNSLLVRSTAAQWDSIRRVIERLDVIPLQVHIEAQILQVNLNSSLEYGVQWYFENAIPAELRPRATSQDWWSDVSGTIGESGLGWTFVGRNMAAIIDLLDNVSDVKVLAAPSLVVLNNKSASINVGTQIPVVSSFLNPIGSDPGTGTGNFGTSYVQFRDTGITLDVTPRVNPGGLVFMEISQNDSEISGAAIGGNLPVAQRTITTEVAVQSGQTVLLGGLIKQTDSDGKRGVPGLSRIPIIGALFGTHNRSSVRQELLVLIKPTVVRNGQEARRITEEYREKFRGLAPLRVIDETER